MSASQKIIDLLVFHMGVPAAEANVAARLREDLGLDSLDEVELTTAVEEEFGLDIHSSDSDKIRTVGDIISYVETKTTTIP